MWPPWHSTTNNIANFDPRFYDPARAPVITSARSSRRRRSLQRHRPAGRRVRRRRATIWPSPRTRACRRSSAVSRAASRIPTTTCSSRASARRTHSTRRPSSARASASSTTASTLNDSSLLGGNPPFQPMVTVANGSVDNPGGAGGTASDLPFGMQGQEIAFKHPTAYTWSAGVQREIAVRVRRRCDLRRPSRPLPAARAQHQPACGRHADRRCRLGPTSRPYRPYIGYSALRIAENSARSIYNSLQLSADKRYANGLKVGARLHAGQVRGQRQRQARRAVELRTTTPTSGVRQASTVGTC